MPSRRFVIETYPKFVGCQRVHAIPIKTLPVLTVIMTFRRPCKPNWSQLVALDRRKLLAEVSRPT
jgi:hypothetical protein